jgi:hypothetical protein
MNKKNDDTYKLNKENDLKITFVDHDSKISNFEIKQSHQKLEQEKEQIKKLCEKLERTKKTRASNKTSAS